MDWKSLISNLASGWTGLLALPPAIWATAILIRRHLKKAHSLDIGLKDALLWLFLGDARRRVSVFVNARRYCRGLLANPKYSRLIVPGKQDSDVDIDSIF